MHLIRVDARFDQANRLLDWSALAEMDGGRSPLMGPVGALPSPLPGLPNISSPANYPSVPSPAYPPAMNGQPINPYSAQELLNSRTVDGLGGIHSSASAQQAVSILGPGGTGLQAILCCELKAGMVWQHTVAMLSCNSLGQPLKVIFLFTGGRPFHTYVFSSPLRQMPSSWMG